ncbi:hypothetical protein BESB_014310 [Besnoitia besnoiti]|uniref:Transmembrane protein n=1 Tax=Besnoitia besnoiti TaxID=94643 RepID=A0A2A9M2V7_BESBE|nr:hypothetical protein BESB_014310 [Besnoitia besnoiti]PFH32818.1 hypothetical protein BESB_014310 [Besnoitia besnoiti]
MLRSTPPGNWRKRREEEEGIHEENEPAVQPEEGEDSVSSAAAGAETEFDMQSGGSESAASPFCAPSLFDERSEGEQRGDNVESREAAEGAHSPHPEPCGGSESSMSSFDVLSSNVEEDDSDDDEDEDDPVGVFLDTRSGVSSLTCAGLASLTGASTSSAALCERDDCSPVRPPELPTTPGRLFLPPQARSSSCGNPAFSPSAEAERSGEGDAHSAGRGGVAGVEGGRLGAGEGLREPDASAAVSPLTAVPRGLAGEGQKQNGQAAVCMSSLAAGGDSPILQRGALCECSGAAGGIGGRDESSRVEEDREAGASLACAGFPSLFAERTAHAWGGGAGASQQGEELLPEAERKPDNEAGLSFESGAAERHREAREREAAAASPRVSGQLGENRLQQGDATGAQSDVAEAQPATGGDAVVERSGSGLEGEMWTEVERKSEFACFGDPKSELSGDDRPSSFGDSALNSRQSCLQDARVDAKVQQLQRTVNTLKDSTEGELLRLREKSEELEALVYALVSSSSPCSLPPCPSPASFETAVSSRFVGRPATSCDSWQVGEPFRGLAGAVECRAFGGVRLASLPFLSAAETRKPSPDCRHLPSEGTEARLPAPPRFGLQAPRGVPGDAFLDEAPREKLGAPRSFFSQASALFAIEGSSAWVDAQQYATAVPSNIILAASEAPEGAETPTAREGGEKKKMKKRGFDDVVGRRVSPSISAFSGRLQETAAFGLAAHGDRPTQHSSGRERESRRGGVGANDGAAPTAARASAGVPFLSMHPTDSRLPAALAAETSAEAQKPKKTLASVVTFFQSRAKQSGVCTLSAAASAAQTTPWVEKLREVGERLVFEAKREAQENQAMGQEDGDVTETEEDECEREERRTASFWDEPETRSPDGVAAETVSEDEEDYAFVVGDACDAWEADAPQREAGEDLGGDAQDAEDAQQPEDEKKAAEGADAVSGAQEMHRRKNVMHIKSFFAGTGFFGGSQGGRGAGREEGADPEFASTQEEDEEDGELSEDEETYRSPASQSVPPPWLADLLPFLNPLSYPVRLLARVLGLNINGSFDRWRTEVQRQSLRGTAVLGVLDATVCVGLVVGLVCLSLFVGRVLFKTMYVHVHAIEEEKVPHYFEGFTYKFWGKKPIYFSDVQGRDAAWVAQRVNWYRPHGY